MVQAIVAKGPDRNENERRFISGLAKAGYTAQADGTVTKVDPAVAEAEAAAARRQQPKRQTKAKRQATGSSQAPAKTSLEKTEQPKGEESQEERTKASSGSAPRAKSGQRKGQQRPKHPSSKK